MTLRPGEVRGRAIAVFPFLKTSEPVRLGDFTFRSTDDTTDLSREDSDHVREVADMLFLQDDLRIRSAAYAMLPALDLDQNEPCLQELKRVQAIVAYCYSAPHPTLGDPLLHYEQASLAIFSPEPVSIFLVRPEHHAEAIAPHLTLTPDEWHRVPGYEGRYNFRHPFWVVKNSRIYPPVPHITLNISQDLAHDSHGFLEEPQHNFLPELLQQPATETTERVLTALTWYNRANAVTGEDDTAVINLAAAFETLLRLPRDSKSDRIVDAVSLLLGRIPRLGLWVRQFYDARNDVAHEGITRRLYFSPTEQKNLQDSLQYNSLLAYGRQIFQLCVGAVLFGAHLGARARLQDKLKTNQERFEFICKTFDDENLALADRFAAIEETVALISEFRFVREPGLLIAPMIGAVQRAAKSLLLCSSDPLDPVFEQALKKLGEAKPSRDFYEVLDALQAVTAVKMLEAADPRSPRAITRRLAAVVWDYTFMHYFWLKERQN
jgi:Apea-like HEPN